MAFCKEVLCDNYINGAWFINGYKMKVALYARVSMDEAFGDKRYQEPENQLVPLREWAARMGWEVKEEFVDRGSGADPNRPEFKRMMNEAMMMRFNNVLVWKLDRFSRETMSQVVGRIQKLKERGVGIKSLTEEWLDTSKENPISELIMAFMSWSAAEDRRKISERTKAGIIRLKNIGQWRGGRPKKVPLVSSVDKTTTVKTLVYPTPSVITSEEGKQT